MLEQSNIKDHFTLRIDHILALLGPKAFSLRKEKHYPNKKKMRNKQGNKDKIAETKGIDKDRVRNKQN